MIIIVSIVLLGLMLTAPVKIPVTIKRYGKILPVRQWILKWGNDGQLIYLTIHNQTGLHSEYCVNEMERGEIMKFGFHPMLQNRCEVTPEDTIGYTYSSKAQERLIALQGQLSVAKRTLQANRVGEKEPVIHEHERRLQQATARAAEQGRIYHRTAKLYKDKLISEEEYDVALLDKPSFTMPSATIAQCTIYSEATSLAKYIKFMLAF